MPKMIPSHLGPQGGTVTNHESRNRHVTDDPDLESCPEARYLRYLSCAYSIAASGGSPDRP